ncbi:MAG: hypothetical protein B6I32_07240 [Desulfobacterium sp. 4572_20]|nr:MAG: hypothetical protein B6I32_07240 [Desulfobacterium sp. 4572_20]
MEEVDLLDSLVAKISKSKELDSIGVMGDRHIVKARSLLCYWAARELGVTIASLAKRLKISPAAVTQSVLRGERLGKINMPMKV